MTANPSIRLWAIAFAAVLALGQPALAQSSAPSGGSGAQTRTTSVPPYEPQLLRLSEILGAVHYLSGICKTEDLSAWRNQMNMLLEAEKPEPERRRNIVDRFNRGYNGFSDVYRRCTPSAELALQRYLREGADIARDIVTRFAR